ncbi:hypothetical protein [Ralstonia pseudosolanacearum]
MAAANSAILVCIDSAQRTQVLRAIEVKPATFVFPLQWLTLRKLQRAQLLDTSLCLSKVEATKVVGIPSPRDLYAPFFAYVLLIAIGWITLSTPLLIRFSLSETRKLSLDEAKDYLDAMLRQSSMDPQQSAYAAKRIRRAGSVQEIASVIAALRE